MDKELLFKPSLPERDVEIPGKGTVRVRALTRAEMHHATKKGGGVADADPEVVERHMVATGLVDPVLTVAEVAKWFTAASAAEAQPVIRAISELSGTGEDAPKSGVPEVRDEPGS